MAEFHFGVCASPDKAGVAAEAGCAFLEPGFAAVATLLEEAFRAGLATVKASGIPVLAMNSMLPGYMKLYGSNEDREAVLDFVRKGMERAAQLGNRIVVFGSGTARQIPAGSDRAETAGRLRALLGEFCTLAAPYGIRIAVEPLRAEETNWLHTVTEAAELLTSLPADTDCGINPDIYHMTAAKEPFSVLTQYKDRILHLHVSAPDRHFPLPGNEAADNILPDFLRAVDRADGCRDVSIEGITSDFAADVKTALLYLQRLAKEL